MHRINHAGTHYRVEGPHLVAPSPQRTPLLFQAGSSPAGMGFAARHAEAQFLIAPTPAAAAQAITAMRKLLPTGGRSPSAIKFSQGLSFVIGSSDEEVARRDRELDEAIDQETMITHSLDQPISSELQTEGARSLLDWVRAAVPDRVPTVRDVGLSPVAAAA